VVGKEQDIVESQCIFYDIHSVPPAGEKF
jgi:hypothetical protein